MSDYICPGDPRYLDPFSIFQVHVLYEWTCIKNGEVVKSGTRTMRTVTSQKADELIEHWNTTMQTKKDYIWMYRRLE